jgi:serine acetyltransferase
MKLAQLVASKAVTKRDVVAAVLVVGMRSRIVSPYLLARGLECPVLVV